MTPKPPTPVLTSIYYVAAALDLVLAACAIILLLLKRIGNQEAIAAVLFLVISALVSYGLGQAVSYLAQAAHFSRLTYEATIAIANRPAPTIEARKVRLPPLPGEETYHVRMEADTQGPFTRSQLEAMRKRGMIDDRNYVIREGESTWIKFGDLGEFLSES